MPTFYILSYLAIFYRLIANICFFFITNFGHFSSMFPKVIKNKKARRGDTPTAEYLGRAFSPALWTGDWFIYCWTRRAKASRANETILASSRYSSTSP